MDWMIRKIRGIGWCPHGKDSGSPPQPASPKEQGQAQTGVNTQTAALQTMLNRYNSNSPTGSTTWQSRIDPLEQQRYDRDLQTYNAQQSGYLNALKNNGGSTYGLTAPNAPAAPIASQWTQNTTLTPGQQQLFDLKQSNQAQLYGQASQALAKPVDLSHLPSQVSNLGLNNDYSAERQKAEDALYNRSTSRLDPQYAQTQSDLETKLYNQGISPVSMHLFFVYQD